MATVSRVDKTEIWLLAVGRNGRGGVAQRRALRRAARADDHRDWRDQGRASCRPLGPGTVRNLWQPLRAAQAPGASTARGHIYLAPDTTVVVRQTTRITIIPKLTTRITRKEIGVDSCVFLIFTTSVWGSRTYSLPK